MAQFEARPRQKVPREDPRVMRAIAKGYAEELFAISEYTYAAILLQEALSTAGALFSAISMDEMRHHRALGELLRELGGSFALSQTVRNTPYRLNEDEDSHAVVVARRILKDREREERAAVAFYKEIAAAAKTEAVRATLEAVARDEESHAAALCNLEKRLAYS